MDAVIWDKAGERIMGGGRTVRGERARRAAPAVYKNNIDGKARPTGRTRTT